MYIRLNMGTSSPAQNICPNWLFLSHSKPRCTSFATQTSPLRRADPGRAQNASCRLMSWFFRYQKWVGFSKNTFLSVLWQGNYNLKFDKLLGGVELMKKHISERYQWVKLVSFFYRKFLDEKKPNTSLRKQQPHAKSILRFARSMQKEQKLQTIHVLQMVV